MTSTFFQRLHRWPAFRLILADRIHRHFFNGGVLDDSNPDESKVKAVIDEAAGELAPLLQERLGESVDLEFWRYWTNPGSSRRSYLLGPNDEHFRDAGYWPETEPPTFVPNGGEVSAGSTLTMSAGSGTIFFTTDGSPSVRRWGFAKRQQFWLSRSTFAGTRYGEGALAKSFGRMECADGSGVYGRIDAR